MAKLTRKTQKIFASNTDSDQITAFGTAKTSNPEYTTDVDKIQSNVFLQGWTPSLMSDLAPYLQDSNGLWYAVTRQLAYLYQQGIAEWDVNTEYTQGSLVSRYNNGDIEIYMSLQNNNTGNQLTEASYWKKYDLSILNNLPIDIDNLKNRIYLKTTYISGTSGYNIWSNGYCRQWGTYNNNSQVRDRVITISFMKTFKDTNYCLLANAWRNDNENANRDVTTNIIHKTTSNFKGGWYMSREPGTAQYLSWEASGYLASGQY